MSTITRGKAAEAAVLQALPGAGIHVLIPFGDGLPFDLAGVAPDRRRVRSAEDYSFEIWAKSTAGQQSRD